MKGRMKPRQRKVRNKLMTFFMIFLKKKQQAQLYTIFIFLSLLIFGHTGEARFVRETKEEDEDEMAKSSLTEASDENQNDESEG